MSERCHAVCIARGCNPNVKMQYTIYSTHTATILYYTRGRIIFFQLRSIHLTATYGRDGSGGPTGPTKIPLAYRCRTYRWEGKNEAEIWRVASQTYVTRCILSSCIYTWKNLSIFVLWMALVWHWTSFRLYGETCRAKIEEAEDPKRWLWAPI